MLVAIDIETYDPNLKKLGPGAVRHDGDILGVGMYCPEGNITGYYPAFDPGDHFQLLDFEENRFIQDILADESITKIFHNGVYDLNWLVNGYGFKVKGRCEDTMTREQFLDSYRFSYSLDSCCASHGIQGKNKGETIEQWWLEHGDTQRYGKKAIENLFHIPTEVCAKYCIQDCKATYDLYMAQQPLLEEQNLLNTNEIEVQLYPILIEMMGNGFRINDKNRLDLANRLWDEQCNGIKELERKYGFESGTLSLNAASCLKRIWEAEGIPLKYTDKGAPSFTADILAQCDHPVAAQIHHLKTIIKTMNTFLYGGFKDNQYKEHVYSTFYPAKRDDGGTVTGRWSSQNINLQQIPAREDKYGKEIRSLFIPEDNCILGAFDYKQIEYRVFMHFATACGMPATKDLAQKFHDDPNTDYHQMTIDLMGWNEMGKEGRHLAKNFNFGSIYGLGPKSFSERFRSSLLAAHPNTKDEDLFDLAKSLMNEYFAKVPFARPTTQKIQDIAQRRGYVKTLSGRRQRVPEDGKIYKMVNYLIQGSAADILKKGLIDAYKKGVFNTLKLHAVVHDENVFSIPNNREGYEASKELYECMRSSYELAIPIGVDTEIGPDWGHCTEAHWNEFEERMGMFSQDNSEVSSK